MNGIVNNTIGELTEKNDALKAIVLALKEQIEELKRSSIFAKWCRRSTDERRGGTFFGTWEEFHGEFKGKYYSEYSGEEAWANLHWLMQQRTIKESLQYVKEFNELVLQISDMGENEQINQEDKDCKLWEEYKELSYKSVNRKARKTSRVVTYEKGGLSIGI
ncbi:hypothetical protein PVK06_005279 [Gossypium arboreum]|uniref:Retrotransposon gag domain-containing protein n=1 Tax=Gossypium arboreum TaxID=29729 RepID=A0ABR0QU93_GOSAR|nr:hypothetical protein PVK06_005279 [Gossypium arboreum]